MAMPMSAQGVPSLQMKKVDGTQIHLGLRNNLRAATGSLWWGYCDETAYTKIGIDNAGSDVVFSAATRVDASALNVYDGNQISGMRFAVGEPVVNSRVYILPDLEGSAPIYEQTVGTVNDVSDWIEVSFDEPIDIPEGEFYICYDVSPGRGSTGYPIYLSSVAHEGACYLNINNQGWEDYAELEGWTALMIQIELSGDNMPENAISYEAVSDGRAENGREFTLQGQVKNMGVNAIESLEITSTISGVADPVVQTVECSIATGSTGIFTITLPAIETGEYDVEMAITKINGEAYSEAGNSLTAHVSCYDKLYDKTVVVEEGTGTWCGYCPRGIVGLEYMKTTYPDSFIAIGVHNGDAMASSTYQEFVLNYFTGFPLCVVNRWSSLVIDPNATDLELAYQIVRSNPAIGDITITSASFNEAGDAITVTTESEFGFSGSASYRVAIVLLENDVTGYRQTNYFAGGIYGEMGGWEDMASYVDWSYDDVARGIYGSWRGSVNSLPSEVTAGEIYTYTYEFTTKQVSQASIQDKDQLEAVALLINTQTQEIENAHKLAIKYQASANTVGQDNVNIYAEGGKVVVVGDYTDLKVYTVSGMLVENENLAHGVYIVEVTTDSGRIVRKLGI